VHFSEFLTLEATAEEFLQYEALDRLDPGEGAEKASKQFTTTSFWPVFLFVEAFGNLKCEVIFGELANNESQNHAHNLDYPTNVSKQRK